MPSGGEAVKHTSVPRPLPRKSGYAILTQHCGRDPFLCLYTVQHCFESLVVKYLSWRKGGHLTNRYGAFDFNTGDKGLFYNLWHYHHAWLIQ